MTTIAYRDGVLAADTLVSYGSFTNGNVNKIHVVERKLAEKTDRVMVALSGIFAATEPMLEWVKGGCEQDDIPHFLLEKDDNFSCLMVTEDGSLYEYNMGYFIKCDNSYHAHGSGAMFALGAMAVGASAPEAVSAAIKHDKATGGTICMKTCDDLKQKEAA